MALLHPLHGRQLHPAASKASDTHSASIHAVSAFSPASKSRCLSSCTPPTDRPARRPQDAFIPTDRMSGRSRGFGFVTMDEAGAKSAISEMDGQEFMGRTVRGEHFLHFHGCP